MWGNGRYWKGGEAVWVGSGWWNWWEMAVIYWKMIRSQNLWVLKARTALQERHNESYSVLSHRHIECLLNRLFKRTSKKTSKLRVTGISEGNPSVTGKCFHRVWWCYFFVFTGGNAVYHNDNLRCHMRIQSWPHDNARFSVYRHLNTEQTLWLLTIG